MPYSFLPVCLLWHRSYHDCFLSAEGFFDQSTIPLTSGVIHTSTPSQIIDYQGYHSGPWLFPWPACCSQIFLTDVMSRRYYTIHSELFRIVLVFFLVRKQMDIMKFRRSIIQSWVSHCIFSDKDSWILQLYFGNSSSSRNNNNNNNNNLQSLHMLSSSYSH